MTDSDIKEAFSKAAEPGDAGFSQATTRRVAERQRWRRLLFVLMALIAALCFAGLLVALKQMASVWLVSQA